LNESLSGDLDLPLRIGIGVHIGVAIVGELGYGATRALTAIGDTVNTASRLESLTKEYKCEVILSDDLIATAGIDIGDWPAHEISVRGRSGNLVVRAITDGALLPEPPPNGRAALETARNLARAAPAKPA
jgi:adenylate cyclase